ncbi:MAG: uroporphyrinogen decarboxylase [Sinobacteraceae bacterium]|nr:uroporphyrinogen decarboxylase [Nevskiaceae bacterium]MBV9912384.1 uroporphyrinogen decarboxylase [Nevskiaceae bacterium]
MSAFLAACRGQPAAHTPIWIMRQAGRYLPEYRQLRAKVDFQTLTRRADLAAEVTLQPLRRFELDAAILFSDIMTPLQGMGVDLSFEPGPVVAQPIRTDAQIDALPALVPQQAVPFVLESIRLIRPALPRGVPLIGFAGGPFTLLCYLVSGRPSKEFGAARSFLYSQPDSAERLLDRLGDAMAAYLGAQAEAGAQALMLFESWAGLLAPAEFTRFALRAVHRTVNALRKVTDVPLIYYVNQGAALMQSVRQLDVDVIGVDWRAPLDTCSEMLGSEFALQGNLDPAALFAPPAELQRLADAVLLAGRGARGHIFNLGHGIWPDTNPDAVARLVDYVHARSGGSGDRHAV